MLRIEGHADPGVLEARLFDLVRETKSSGKAGAWTPVAIVVPSRLLGDHLRTRLAAELGSLLDVSVLHHAALQQQAAALAGARLPRRLPRSVREALLAETLRAEGGELAAYAASRPGSVSALLSTMDDLREAGADPDRARSVKGLSAGGRRTLAIYRAYAAGLEALLEKGLSDRAGATRAALPHVESWARARGFARVIHYGAYDLTGRALGLLKALETVEAEVHFLLPWNHRSPAYAFARRFLEQTLGAGEPVEPPEAARPRRVARLLGHALPSLYDEEAACEAPPEGSVQLFHAQGAAAELKETALRILDIHRRDGTPLSEFAIVARNLDPYVPAIREARALAAVWLARAIYEDFERQPLMDLFRSGLFKLRGGEQHLMVHSWDRMSRELRLSRGFQAWTRDLPHWMDQWEPRIPHDADDVTRERASRMKQRRRREAYALADTLIDLHKSAREVINARGWSAWAGAMRRLCENALDGFKDGAEGGDDAGVAAVMEALSEIGLLERAGIPFTKPGVLDRFRTAVAESILPMGPVGGRQARGDNGGVRVLDAMQARGLSFDTVFLVGFNADLFPRRASEDAFLKDPDRRLLRESLGAPVPAKLAGREEEHLILAQMLGAARRNLVVSWQRADEKGRARVPSLALREISRLALGAADLKLPLEKAYRVRAHPAESSQHAVERFGLQPPVSALMGAAFEVRSPSKLRESVKQLASIVPADEADLLDAGLSMLAVVESFSRDNLSHDAFIGAESPPPGIWSPSRLETFSNCPQQYFFRHMLRVEELAEPAEGHEMDVRETGERIHKILYDVYRRLIDDGDLHREGAGRTAPLVMQAVEDAWAENTADLAQRMHPRYPILWKSVSEIWKNGLRTFLLYDIARLRRGGIRILDLEKPASASIPLGADGLQVAVHGRFDRVARESGTGLVVSDYKSAGKLSRHVDAASVLKGHRIQMPLYVLMAETLAAEWGVEGASAKAEVIGVGPEHVEGLVPDDADAGEAPGRAELAPETFSKIREGFLETIRVLDELAGSGRFPFREGDRCRYCPYDRACRRRHAPTVARVGTVEEIRSFQLLDGKSTRAKTLAEVSRSKDGGGS